MNADASECRMQYLEHVQLYLWFKGSPFSLFQGKADAAQAEKHRRLAHDRYEQYLLASIGRTADVQGGGTT
jgi:spore coat polysaccharide biosynthesis protein SpsF (cytidylyltransferase family)